MTKPTTPRGLADRGRRFWRRTVAEFALDDGELELLAEVCRTMDTLDRLAAQLAADGTMIPGAAGQSVMHPCIGEARQQRAAMYRLLAALSLPDEDGNTVVSARTTRARTAAAARWSGQDTEAAARRAGA